MAYDAFLKFEGLAADQSENGIQLISFHWGVNDGDPAGAVRGGGRPQPLDLAVVKQVDATSPALMLACVTGKHFDKATLLLQPFAQDPGTTGFEYRVVLSDVLVESVDIQGNEGGEEKPVEQVGLDYLKFELISDGNRSSFDFRRGRSF